jgi:hypothetical protein
MKPVTLMGVMAILVAAIASPAAQGRQTAPPPPPPAAAPATTDLAVTVSYSGKGVVDTAHAIVVFAFSEPNPGPQSRPLGAGPAVATKNGQTVTLKGITAPSVYIVAVYNEKTPYDGLSGPPAAGTPVGVYSKDGKAPTLVAPGSKTAVKMSFNDAKRFGQ